MRATLNLCAEAWTKVRQLARQRCKTISAAVSGLILRTREPEGVPKVRNGVPVFPMRTGADYEGTRPDIALVNRLRDPEL